VSSARIPIVVRSAWASATIEEFEQVSLENGTELFRVRARGRVGEDPEPWPVLACSTREDSRTYEPLSSGGDRRGLLRLAYAVPAGLVDDSSTFWLHLADGARIDLPRPTPGPSRADAGRGRRTEDAPWRPFEVSSEPTPAREEGISQRIQELEQERDRLHRRVDEMTREHAALRAERDEALRGTGAAQAQHDEARRETASVEAQRDAAVAEAEEARDRRDGALHAAAEARAQRDAAVLEAHEAGAAMQTAHAERESVLEATAGARAAHERMTRRLRQHEARFELLRADAQRTQAAFGPGSVTRLRRLEAERAQLIGHARALAELLAISGKTGGPDRSAALNDAADRVVAARDRAIRAAHEQAERDLEKMLADAPS
jgi:hypothetical protein